MNLMTNTTTDDPMTPAAGQAQDGVAVPDSSQGEPEVISIEVPGQIADLGETVGNVHCENPFMVAENVNVHYGTNHAIKDVTLEIGKKADLLVLDTFKPHLTPSGRILSAWIHNGQPSDIEAVMIDGKFVMRDRRVLTLDEDALMAEAARIGERVWDQILRDGPLPVPSL